MEAAEKAVEFLAPEAEYLVIVCESAQQTALVKKFIGGKGNLKLGNGAETFLASLRRTGAA
jgi:hypothetical protein